MKVLLTGAAGFIGWKTAQKLLEEGYEVIGVDNLNDYYDPRLKEWRLSTLKGRENFRFHKVDVENYDALRVLFETYGGFDAVLNLAARAGVRYSIENPFVYFTTNADGTLNLLELSKEFGVKKFVLASTSSLYAGQPMPFKEDLPVNTPISPYAASKKAAEVVSYTYHYLYDLDVTVVRYFTVYGPAGRPDMSIFRFIYKMLKDEPVEVFGDGSQSRDFTFVDDIAEGTIKALKPVGYEIINLGGNHPHKLSEVISILEDLLGKKAKVVYRDFHKADLKATWADITKAKKLLNWSPKVPLEEGLRRTVEWFKENWHWLRDVKI
ncbi:MAG: NAD-dependent epimerase/dehydratase family protein [Aquificae bacterium]|nr:NAD-dependent epimerase/dehydratase family protein [Aquificota bacterium]